MRSARSARIGTTRSSRLDRCRRYQEIPILRTLTASMASVGTSYVRRRAIDTGRTRLITLGIVRIGLELSRFMISRGVDLMGPDQYQERERITYLSMPPLAFGTSFSRLSVTATEHG